MATGCDSCTMLYGNHTTHHEVVFLRWFWWYRYIHDTCCHSSHLEVFVCVCPSTATLVNPNIYRMAQTAKQCEHKLQVPALYYLSFKRSLGWHFAQSLVSRVWCWDTWSPASHVQLSHHGGCCSSSWLRCSPHPGKAPAWLQQFNNLHSFPKTSDSQLCRAYVYLCLLCAYLAWVNFSPSQVAVLIHPFSLQQFKDIRRQHDLCKNGQRVSSGPKCRSVLLLFWRICDHPWPQRASLSGWQFHVVVWVPPLRHVNSKMIVGIFDFQSRSIRVSGKICCR